MRTDLKCPDCGAPMRLQLGKFRRFYGCVMWRKTGCKGSHSAHDNGQPMGTAATWLVRRARKKVMDFAEARDGPNDYPQGVMAPQHVAGWGLRRCNKFLESVGRDPVLAPTAWERLDSLLIHTE